MDKSTVPKSLEFSEITENMYISEGLCPPESDRYECMCEEFCSESCLNYLMEIECGKECRWGKRCRNRRFQRREYKKLVIFDAGLKGKGVKAGEDIKINSFIIEYVGDVISGDDFLLRIAFYQQEGLKHHYAMSLPGGEMIDATVHGNTSRYINHSCEPNCVVQKWMVNGRTRLGIFTLRDVKKGEELAFDYQFDINRLSLQTCYCGSAICRGSLSIGGALEKTLEQSVVKQVVHFNPLSVEDERHLAAFVAEGKLNKFSDVVQCAGLMRRCEELEPRLQLGQVIMKSIEQIRRDLLSCNACIILRIWISQADRYGNSTGKYVSRMMDLLCCLPFPHKTMLEKSQLMNELQKWTDINRMASLVAVSEKVAEMDGEGKESFDPVVLANKAQEILNSWLKLRDDIKIPKRSAASQLESERLQKSPQANGSLGYVSSGSDREDGHRKRRKSSRRRHKTGIRRRHRRFMDEGHNASRSSSSTHWLHSADGWRNRGSSSRSSSVGSDRSAVFGPAQWKNSFATSAEKTAYCEYSKPSKRPYEATSETNSTSISTNIETVYTALANGTYVPYNYHQQLDPRRTNVDRIMELLSRYPALIGPLSTSPEAWVAVNAWMDSMENYGKPAGDLSKPDALYAGSALQPAFIGIIQGAGDQYAQSTAEASQSAVNLFEGHSSSSASVSTQNDEPSQSNGLACSEPLIAAVPPPSTVKQNKVDFKRKVRDLVVQKIQDYVAASKVTRKLTYEEFKLFARTLTKTITAKEEKLLRKGKELKADEGMLKRAAEYLEEQFKKGTYENFLRHRPEPSKLKRM